MPKLYSSAQIVKILKNNGFTFISQKGSHAKYHKQISNKVRTVIVPMAKKEIPLGTFKSILRQSALDTNDFKKN